MRIKQGDTYVMDSYSEHVATVESIDHDGEVRVGRYNTIARGPVVTVVTDEHGKHTLAWLSIEDARQLAHALMVAAHSAENQIERWELYKDIEV